MNNVAALLVFCVLLLLAFGRAERHRQAMRARPEKVDWRAREREAVASFKWHARSQLSAPWREPYLGDASKAFFAKNPP